MTWRERWGLVIGMSLVLWGVSERAFWSMFRPDDNFFLIILGLIPYIVATYLVVCAMQYFRVSTFFEMVLMGALYGWIVEGIVAMTLFGAPGTPFPITISWTGLAWHMLFSVVIMLLWHHRVLAQSFKGSIAFAAIFGLAWGVWSMAWFFETPPVVNTAPLYAVHAALVVGLIALGHWLLGRRVVTAFIPPKVEWIPLAVITAAWFALVTVQVVGAWAAILPVLFGLLAIPLFKSKKRHDAPQIFHALTTRVPSVNLAMFLLTPAIATLFYALILGGVMPPYMANMPVFIITSIVGALLLIFAWVQVLRGERPFFSRR